MRIRKGKDVAIRWRIFTNGNSEPLGGRELQLELKSPFGRVCELPFSISEGNVIEAVFRGVDQQNVGFYSLTLWENKGYDGQTAVDAVRAFELVRTTDEENKVGESPDLTIETIDLGTSDITLTGLTVRDLFGGEELLDLTGDEYFTIKVGDELKTISAMTIMQLMGGGSGEGGGGITYIEGDGINIEGRKISVDTDFVATKDDINTLNEKIDNINVGGSGGGTSGDIPDSAITTSKIADGAVTEAKLSQSVKDSINNKADKSALDNFATKESVQDISDRVSDLENGEGGGGSLPSDITELLQSKQDKLTVEVLDNGNIRIGNFQGQTKDFMPATPSGDPMHYTYEELGAVYNSGEDYTKSIEIYGARSSEIKTMEVTHKSKRWYFNLLGDLTSDEMNRILIKGSDLYYKGAYAGFKERTISLKGNGTASSLDMNSLLSGTTRLFAIYLGQMLYPSNVEKIAFSSNIKYFLGNPRNKGYIIGYEGIIGGTNNFPSIIEIRVMYLKKNATINSPSLSKDSILFMINESSPTTAITISVHADVYAAMSVDADVVAALEEKNAALSAEEKGGSISLLSL